MNVINLREFRKKRESRQFTDRLILLIQRVYPGISRREAASRLLAAMARKGK